jgi:hypothetical protein
MSIASCINAVSVCKHKLNKFKKKFSRNYLDRVLVQIDVGDSVTVRVLLPSAQHVLEVLALRIYDPHRGDVRGRVQNAEVDGVGVLQEKNVTGFDDNRESTSEVKK